MCVSFRSKKIPCVRHNRAFLPFLHYYDVLDHTNQIFLKAFDIHYPLTHHGVWNCKRQCRLVTLDPPMMMTMTDDGDNNDDDDDDDEDYDYGEDDDYGNDDNDDAEFAYFTEV